ncbi:hypothetical protein PTTG_12164 [Puccinia triticina 1-1 BBBD Race 1]|uniref:Uncharacterized protein n=2 Tax=Puccinia triticina TaxID=208348 RepID=A0A180GS00_PUCT1|nr:uncharacterized protein PtA15_6A80 [Puccinia triticina]OAV95159.1 hypothetical protein PTTG_12164 [Puccinia triticina 1-1 BBBD Race 1]WAQ85452.1 hypothetical protein PtA15_6A80 [Puccinia triticina]WAR55335.1 hypothetical protein PtB15_6B74 [Puccinia triticina]
MYNPGTSPSLINDEILSNLPPHSNPFAFMKDALSKNLALPLTRGFVVTLLAFFVFHVLIAGLCLLMLILPIISRSKRSQWLWMKLFVKDKSGELIYRAPLYFFNSGVLVTICQLCNSVISQAFIWCQIKLTGPFDYYRSDQMLALLGVMYVFECVGYCSLSHCFFVTAYYGRKVHGNPSRRRIRCISPPILINMVSICFPLLTIATIMGTIIRLLLIHRGFANKITNLLENLSQASGIWEQLHHKSVFLSSEKTMLLANGMSWHNSQIEELEIGAHQHLDTVIRYFQIFSCTVSSFLCVCCLLFVFSFWKLLRTNLREAKKPKIVLTVAINLPDDENQCDENSSHCQTTMSSVNHIPSSFALSNRQLSSLTIRSLLMFLSMLIAIGLLLILAIKPTNVLLNPYWRGYMTWLSTAGNTFSAICIVWQSWRLFIDQSKTNGAESQTILISKDDMNSRSTRSETIPLRDPENKT